MFDAVKEKLDGLLRRDIETQSTTSPIARYIGCEPNKFASNSRQRQRYALRCKAMSQLAERFAQVGPSSGVMQWPQAFTRRARRLMARLISKRAYQQGIE